MNNRNGMAGCDAMKSCRENGCQDNDPLQGMPLGIGYVPLQQWGQVYCTEKALSRGTIFPPLDLPFCGCIPRGAYRKGGLL